MKSGSTINEQVKKTLDLLMKKRIMKRSEPLHHGKCEDNDFNSRISYGKKEPILHTQYSPILICILNIFHVKALI